MAVNQTGHYNLPSEFDLLHILFGSLWSDGGDTAVFYENELVGD